MPESLSAHGFDTIPTPPRAADVFKRACTAAQRNRIPTGDANRFINLLCRRVGHDGDNIWRRLVAEEVDNDGHTLSYQEVYEFRFHRPTSQIITTVLATPTAEAVQAARQVETYFDANARTLTAYTIREWVRGTLRGLSATVLRDGVYFVRQEHAERLQALDEVVNGLDGDSLFHSLPLVDDRRQREMLRAAFEDESVGEIDRLIGEIREICIDDDRQITSDRFVDFKMQFDRIRERVLEYSELLDVAMEQTGSRLEIMELQMTELLYRVRA